MTREKFEAQSEPTRPIRWIRWTTRAGIFDVWDRAFALSFFEYRRRLAALARENHLAAEGVAVTVGLDDVESWLRAPGDEILVPTDDDDFVRADLARVAEAFDDRTKVVLWPVLGCGFVGPERRRGVYVDWLPLLNMNNCAVRKSYLLEHFSTEEIVQMLAHNHVASRRIAQQLGLPDDEDKKVSTLTPLVHPAVRGVDHRFTMYNVHPGSVSFMHRVLKAPDPVAALRQLELDRAVRLPWRARSFEPFVRRLEAEGRARVGRG